MFKKIKNLLSSLPILGMILTPFIHEKYLNIYMILLVILMSPVILSWLFKKNTIYIKKQEFDFNVIHQKNTKEIEIEF